MRSYVRNPILLGLLSAILLDLPFPIAGPLPPWRAGFSWIALVPLFYGLLAESSVAAPRYLRRSVLAGYACGVLWYILNCYWIYYTMRLYGGPAGVWRKSRDAVVRREYLTSRYHCLARSAIALF